MTPVLIVGAGPTGLVLALWLTKAGVAVRIVDRAPEPGSTSRALVVHARTLEFYRQLGIADAIVNAGTQLLAVNAWSGGTKAARIPFGEIGTGLSAYPYLLVFPQDLHERLLIRELERLGVQIERPVELLSLEQNSEGTTAQLRHADGSEERVSAAYIVGCDGAHSQVRTSLRIPFSGGTYAHQYYVADVEGAGPVFNGEVHISIGSDDFLAVFAMKGAGHARLVGSVRDTTAQPVAPMRWENIDEHLLRELHIQVNAVHWFSTYRVHHRVASSFRDRRVFLAGDAAHVHSPVGGQGMNTGIGDAVNLGWKLAEVLAGRSAPALLDTYEPERIAFARRLVATTDRAFMAITAQGRFANIMRAIVPRVIGAVARLRALQRFAFRSISQIAIEYRASAVSTGVSGSVRAGDRLPWLAPEILRSESDNFASLSSRRWQVHAYGNTDAAVREACAQRNLPLHEFPWRAAIQHAGIRNGAVFAVRPDGYVGFTGEGACAAAMARYLDAAISNA